MNNQEAQAHCEPSVATYYVIFALLLVLLVVTVAIAEVDLGEWNFVVAVGIAAVKATLIVLYFMHVRYGSPLLWLTAGAGFFWLAIMLGLTLGDYWTRGWIPQTEDPTKAEGLADPAAEAHQR